MHQFTIRGFDGELLRRLNLLASTEGLSLHQAVLKLLRRGVGLEDGNATFLIGSGIDKYAGVWSESDASEFEKGQADFEAIDAEMWT